MIEVRLVYLPVEVVDVEVPERGELGARRLVRLLQVPVLALDYGFK